MQAADDIAGRVASIMSSRLDDDCLSSGRWRGRVRRHGLGNTGPRFGAFADFGMPRLASGASLAFGGTRGGSRLGVGRPRVGSSLFRCTDASSERAAAGYPARM